jgi:hypothetical protein
MNSRLQEQSLHFDKLSDHLRRLNISRVPAIRAGGFRSCSCGSLREAASRHDRQAKSFVSQPAF